jgi:hypothetical protein
MCCIIYFHVVCICVFRFYLHFSTSCASAMTNIFMTFVLFMYFVVFFVRATAVIVACCFRRFCLFVFSRFFSYFLFILILVCHFSRLLFVLVVFNCDEWSHYIGNWVSGAMRKALLKNNCTSETLHVSCKIIKQLFVFFFLSLLNLLFKWKVN